MASARALTGGDLMRGNRKGQGMLEYIIIIAVVLAAILVFANGGFETAMGSIYSQTGNQMNNISQNIKLQ